MVSPTLVAAPVTIVPAMGLLWLMLRRYEHYFVFTRVMFALVAGFFAGIVVAVFEAGFDFAGAESVEALGLIPAAFMFVVGYAFFEGGAKTAMLGLARFRRRKDTPYYAAAFGLGFGAMLAMSLLMAAWLAAEQPFNPDYQVLPFLGIVALLLGLILAHAGSTVWVGKGSADGRLVRGWLLGAGLQVPVLLCLWFAWPSLGRGNEVVLVPALASLAYGAALLAYADTRILATIVPPEIRDMVQKERRRAEREAMRDDEPHEPPT